MGMWISPGSGKPAADNVAEPEAAHAARQVVVASAAAMALVVATEPLPAQVVEQMPLHLLDQAAEPEAVEELLQQRRHYRREFLHPA